MDRLHTEKQMTTIHRINLLLQRYKHENDFQKLTELITPHEEEVARIFKELVTLETEVEILPDKMLLKEKVLKLLRSKTKILARSEEERKLDRRGRPELTIEETKTLTDTKKSELNTIEKLRNEKRQSKQQIDDETKKELHKIRNLAAA